MSVFFLLQNIHSGNIASKVGKVEMLSQGLHLAEWAFGQRRKTFMNAFRSAGISDECLHQVQQNTGIALTSRAETLSVHEFRHLSTALPPL